MKSNFRNTAQVSLTPLPVRPIVNEDKKTPEAAKITPRDDRLSSLKAYRKSKGLCFTCGERWGRDHKCASTVQLHVMEELLEALQEDDDPVGDDIVAEAEGTLMAVSSQAIAGVESSKSIRVRGWVQGLELLMLVDSGSTHSFIDEQVARKLAGIQTLSHPVQIKITDGGTMQCDRSIPNCNWWIQGCSFRTEFRVLQLGGYDAILGMDWLEQFSPMKVDWVQKWLEFPLARRLIRIEGI